MVHPEKHKKKHSKRSKRKKYSSSESESSSAEEWIENSVDKSSTDKKRDDWMDTRELVPTYSNRELKAKSRKESRDEDRQLSTLDRPGQHQRELNPYWKDGGHGLPSEEIETKPTTSNSVGDGGLDWLKRAYKRVLDQAKEERKTAEEVAAERWGSLDRLQAMLKEAEEKAAGKDRYTHNRHSSYSSQSRYERKHGREFQKPKDESGLSHSKEHKHSSKTSNDIVEHRSDRKSEINRLSTYETNRSNAKSYCYNRKYSSDKPRWQKASVKEEFNMASSEHKEITNIKPYCKTNTEMSETTSNTDDAGPSKDADKSSTETTKFLEPAPLTLTKKEMNDLGAKIIKAELLGNTDLANKLKAKLNAAKEVAPEDTLTGRKNPEIVTLTQTNPRGLVTPLVLGSTSSTSQPTRGKTKSRKLETHQGGERVRYFQDDGKYTLQQMFEKEKFTTIDDETAMYLKMAGGKSRLTTDDDFTIDDAMLSKQPRYEPEEKQYERQKNRAVKEHKQMQSVLDKCSFCLDSEKMQKHLIVALGSKVYLSLPTCESLVTGHCYIVPMVHVPATTHLDEDVWEEVQIFRRSITKMFKSQDDDVVFMETSLHLRRHPHALIECVPLSMDIGSMAPMYFKKAILECDTEWAQNKKLVDLSKKNIRYSVPKGLPYFAVDFGLDGGFAHVVEDEQLFPDYFGREIVGGMLDLEPRMWHKPGKQIFKDQSQKVLEFEKLWKPFDCTEK